ncbi:MAG: SPOR domain-containing protein [Bacteroidales bacterium]|nr:SPOR domain-containing protein [Bacteroidales bacterium]
MDIAAHIGKLIVKHECVIIPGLGGFLTNYHGAEINSKQQRINPPARKLVFNAELKSNDGMLAHYLSQEMQLSYKSSLQMLDLFVHYCHRDLTEGKQIAFGDLGVLDLNRSGKLEFLPNEKINYNEEVFGLKPIAIKQIDRRNDYQAKAPILVDLRKPNSKVRSINTKLITKVAAVLLPFAILIGAAFYLPGWLGNKENVQEVSFFSYLDSLKSTLFGNEDKATKEIQSSEFEKANEPALVAEPEPTSKDEVLAPVVELIVKEPANDVSGEFHIICGSFLEKNRADLLVNDLKEQGFRAFIAGQSNSGTYRVAIQSFVNNSEANTQMEWIRQQGFKNAWILHKTF